MRLVEDNTAGGKDLARMRQEMSQLSGDPNVKRMLELLQVFQEATAPTPEEPRISTIEAFLQKIRDAHTEPECEYAKAFVCRAFEGCIEPNNADGEQQIYWARITACKKTRKQGLVRPGTPDGWIEHKGINAERLSLYYIDTILEGRNQEKTDEEIIWDMIGYSEANPLNPGSGPLHPGFAFLVTKKDGERALEPWTHYHGFDEESMR